MTKDDKLACRALEFRFDGLFQGLGVFAAQLKRGQREG